MAEQVHISINGKDVEVDKGTSVLAASMKAGVNHMHLCGGHGLCSTCRVRILDGEEHLSEMTTFERFSLRGHLSFASNVRLACQTKIEGAVRLETIFPTIGKLNFKGP
jgi:adenylate cyclase